MNTIYKYQIQIDDDVEIEMHKDARPIHVAMQNMYLYVWAQVDTARPTEMVKFFVRGTGHNCDGMDNAVYVGTVHDRGFVWHVFSERN